MAHAERSPLRFAMLAAAYAAAAVLLDLASGFFVMKTGLAICYPPAGLFLAAILLFGWRALPLAFLNPCFSLLVTLSDPDITWPAVLSISAASMISPSLLLAAAPRLGFERGRLDSLRAVFAFTLVACAAVALESLVSACAYVVTGLSPASDFVDVAWGWWVSVVLPYLALTPVFLLWAARRPAPGAMPLRRRLAGYGLITLLAPIALWAVMSSPPEGHPLRLYLAFLPLLLGAIALGLGGAAWAGLLTTACALVMAPGALVVPRVIVEAQAFLVVVNIAGLLTGSVVDERLRTETALRQSEGLYRKLLEVTDTGYVTLSEDGIVIDANEEYLRLTGRTRLEEIVGRSVVDWTAPHDRERNAREVRACLETGRVRHLEIDYVRPDGSLQPIEINAAVVTADGTRRILTLCRDVRERRQMEERLRQGEKLEAVGRIAGGVAHDFNNQLTGILGYAEMLASQLEDASLRGYAENIRRAAEHSAELTRQLLAFGRKGRFQSVPVDVHRTVREVEKLIRHSIDKRIRIRVRLEAHPAVVTGDPSQIQNAILNLALNARDAMPGSGELAFETDSVALDAGACRELTPEVPPGRYVRIAVSDTGVGMDEATRLHLFEPFYTTKAIGKGTGLGLAAVYGAVRNHHGALRIDSAPGRGTTIAAYLPESGDDDTPAEPGPPVPTVRPGRILVVDDEEVVRHLATEQLRTAGHQVIPCADGLEAIRLVEQGGDGTDLVLLDLVMPGMSGGDTFHALRALRPGIRVLLASGYSVNDEAQALLGLGACGFVQKPFRAEALLRAVADALRTDRDAS